MTLKEAVKYWLKDLYENGYFNTHERNKDFYGISKGNRKLIESVYDSIELEDAIYCEGIEDFDKEEVFKLMQICAQEITK